MISGLFPICDLHYDSQLRHCTRPFYEGGNIYNMNNNAQDIEVLFHPCVNGLDYNILINTIYEHIGLPPSNTRAQTLLQTELLLPGLVRAPLARRQLSCCHGRRPRSLRDAGYFPGFVNTPGDLFSPILFTGEAVSHSTHILHVD